MGARPSAGPEGGTPPGRPATPPTDDLLVEAKREFYRQPDVAGGYDAQRFGGRSGAWVNARELGLVCDLLPPGGLVADIACGTGRLTAALRRRGDRVVPCDASVAMLRVAVANGEAPVVQSDAFALPLADGRCDGATALRLLFHFADPLPLLREMRRIVHPGGTLVCDTYNWSARARLPLGSARWGAKVSAIAPRQFRAVASSAGWAVRAERPCFLISPYVYRRLPLPVVRALASLERRSPRRLLCRAFWALEAR